MAGDLGHVGTAANGKKGGFAAGQWEGWRIQRAANEKTPGMLLVFGQPTRKRRNIKEQNRPVEKLEDNEPLWLAFKTMISQSGDLKW
jgi:hypothetical protein